MLRTLGASRPQLLATVGLEALVLGLLGAALGLAGGVGFAFGINELFKAVGIDLPNTGTVVTLRTVIVSLIVGVVVTLVAALVPALRATRVTPMAALRDAELQDSKPRGRVVTAVALVVGLGRAGDDARRPVRRHRRLRHRRRAARRRRGADAVRRLAVLAAAGAPARVAHRAPARAAARPHRPARARERDAQARPHRHHRRGAHDRAGAGGVRDHLRRGPEDLGGEDDRRELPRRDRAPEQRRLLADPARGRRDGPREVDGVDTVSSITYATGALPSGGENVRVAAVDPATLGSVLALTFKSGDPSVLAGLGPHDAIVDDAFAREQGARGGRHAAPAHPARANGDASRCAAPWRASSTCSARRSWTRAPPGSSAGSSRASRWRGSRRTPLRSRCRTRWTPR